MRKSLIITAALMVSSLFAGSALADERGVERPTVRSIARADRNDGAKAYADKIRDRNESNSRAVTTAHSTSNKLDKQRQKGDMVEGSTRSRNATHTQREQNQGKALIARTVSEKRADIQDRSKKSSTQNNSGNKRAFTVANDRRGHASHDGPKTIVDVMARRELLKFLGATGVKINCSQTGTCTADPI